MEADRNIQRISLAAAWYRYDIMHLVPQPQELGCPLVSRRVYLIRPRGPSRYAAGTNCLFEILKMTIKFGFSALGHAFKSSR